MKQYRYGANEWAKQNTYLNIAMKQIVEAEKCSLFNAA